MLLENIVSNDDAAIVAKMMSMGPAFDSRLMQEIVFFFIHHYYSCVGSQHM